ncbi:uncharacterized protein uimc1 [Eucyclogobius newberryi]|uniref:uncharacterized protein uimc1 n=1 Tax=Eucyclogobius newberryi TaxID=166745 RepID=UPI003B5C0E40
MPLRKRINREHAGVFGQQEEDKTQEDNVHSDKDEVSSPATRERLRRERPHKMKTKGGAEDTKHMTEEEMMDLALRLSEQEASVTARRLQEEDEAVRKAIQDSMFNDSQSLMEDAALCVSSRRKLVYSNGESQDGRGQRTASHMTWTRTRRPAEGSPLMELPDLSQTQPSPSSPETAALCSPQSCDSTQIEDCDLPKSPVFPSSSPAPVQVLVQIPRLEQTLLDSCTSSGFVLCSQDSSAPTQNSHFHQHVRSPTFPKSPALCATNTTSKRSQTEILDVANGTQLDPNPARCSSPVFGQTDSKSALKSQTSDATAPVFSSQESASSFCLGKDVNFVKSPVFSKTQRGPGGVEERGRGSPVLGTTKRTEEMSEGDAADTNAAAANAADANAADANAADANAADANAAAANAADANVADANAADANAEEQQNTWNLSERELTCDMTLRWSDEGEGDATPVASPSPVFPEEKCVPQNDVRTVREKQESAPTEKLCRTSEAPCSSGQAPAEAPCSSGHAPAEALCSSGHAPAEPPCSSRHSPAEAPCSSGHAPAEAPCSSGHAPAEAPCSSGHAPAEAPCSSGHSPAEAPCSSGHAPTEAPCSSGRSPTEAPCSSGHSPPEAPCSSGHSPAEAPCSSGHSPAEAPCSSGHSPAEAPCSSGHAPAHAPCSSGHAPAHAPCSSGHAPAQATVHYYWGVPFCPRGLDPSDYTKVIVAQLEVYEKSLKWAQRSLLPKVTWGQPILPRPENSPSAESNSPQTLLQARRSRRRRGNAKDPQSDEEEETQRSQEEEADEETREEMRKEARKETQEEERKETREESDCEVCPETQLSDDDRTQELTPPPQALVRSPEVEAMQAGSPSEAEQEEPMEAGPESRPEPEKPPAPLHSKPAEVGSEPLRSESPDPGPVQCPLCQRGFPSDQIEMHAAFCDGEPAAHDRVSPKPRRKRARREEAGDHHDHELALEKCYICHRSVPIREYGRHTEKCLQRRAPRAAATVRLLSALDQSEQKDPSEAGPSGPSGPSGPRALQPQEVIDLIDDDDDEDSVSLIRVSDSPIRSFTSISEAQDCLIDFSSQHRGKRPRPRAGPTARARAGPTAGPRAGPRAGRR